MGAIATSTGNDLAAFADGRQLETPVHHRRLAGLQIPRQGVSMRLALVGRDDQVGELMADGF